ncbi:MAG: PQQ-like beta-propeller repeat protein [Proteobacteria bacterium]|nr:PQQ-like beta-propeller repeat protein [Pseudomonadota bacterium]
MGCASANGPHANDVKTAPRSAQFDVELDWDYALKPGIPKYLGSVPLEMGSIQNIGPVTYIASSLGKVIAIDNASGRGIWSQDFEMPITSGPVGDAKSIYIALSSGTIHRLNPRTGESVWHYETGGAVENGLSVGEGIVACVNVNNRAFAINAEDGTLLWRRERPRPNEFSMYGQSSPLIENGMVYLGFSDGYVVAYAAENGTAVWSRELAPDARFKDMDVKPVRDKDALYVAASSGGLYALSADDGHTLWQRDIYGITSIRVFQNSLYVSSQSGILRIEKKSGDTIWQNVIQKEALISELQLGKTYIYASVQKYGLVMLDRVDGTLRHVIDLGSDFTTPPQLSPGVLTAMSNNSTVYRFIVNDEPIGQ